VSNRPLDPLAVLGERIRERRKVVGLSLRALAARLEISVSALSQIETGRSHPSVASLYEIARALDVPLDSLFRDRDGLAEAQPAPAAVAGAPAPAQSDSGVNGSPLRAGDRPTLDLDSGVNWQMLTPTADPDVDFLYVRYPPQGCSSEHMLSHPGREFGLVLEGSLTVTINTVDRVLEAGDSIQLDSNVPHRLRNEGQVRAIAVWVVLSDPHA